MLWVRASVISAEHGLAMLGLIICCNDVNRIYMFGLPEQAASVIQLEWTGALKGTNNQRQIVNAEFLQPYSSANDSKACSSYATCLACATDTACVWCDNGPDRRCTDRLNSSVASCTLNAGSLILVASHCPVCADYVSCRTCVQVCVHNWKRHIWCQLHADFSSIWYLILKNRPNLSWLVLTLFEVKKQVTYCPAYKLSLVNASCHNV
jgi:hypothetical protein